MDYSSQNKTSDSLTTSGFQLLWLPTNEKKVQLLDVDLYNLKRAYNLSLESHEIIGCSGIDSPKSKCEEEEDCLTAHHPIELCETQITEVDENVNCIQSGKHDCGHCNFKGTIVQLQSHTKYCHPVESSRSWCDECQHTFENETDLKLHMTQEHFCCSHCNKKFEKQKLLLAHLPIHKEERCLKCPTCGKEFSSHRHLLRHLESHEKKLEVMEKEMEDYIYQCTVCHKNFTKKESLAKHIKIHTRELLKCSLCDFTCGEKVAMKMHFISHEGNRKYKCNRCDFSFKQVGHLKRHIARFNH